MGASVEIEGLTKSFGSQNIWRDVTMDIPPGEITALLGPSGTGKSVFLKTVMGLLTPEAGSCRIDGVDMVTASERERQELRRHFGVLFQDGAMFGSMSVLDNVAFPLREHTNLSEDEIRTRTYERLELVGLVGEEHKLPGEISGGMRKRAGLARSLVMDPSIVLCDEPDSGLDPVRTSLLAELIVDVNAATDATIIVVTHDIRLARKLPDNLGMLYRRELVAFGPRELVLTSTDPVLEQFFAGRTQGPIGMSEESDSARSDVVDLVGAGVGAGTGGTTAAHPAPVDGGAATGLLTAPLPPVVPEQDPGRRYPPASPGIGGSNRSNGSNGRHAASARAGVPGGPGGGPGGGAALLPEQLRPSDPGVVRASELRHRERVATTPPERLLTVRDPRDKAPLVVPPRASAPVRALRLVGDLFALALDTVRLSFARPYAWRETLEQFWFLAVVSILPAALVAIPFGAVIALQLGSLTVQLGAQSFTGAASVLAVIQQASPIVTALVIAGAGGAAICADIGSRQIREEIDAMKVLGVNPVQRLGVPRVHAAVLVAVLLNGLVSVVGVLGGYFFNVIVQGGTPGAYLASFTALAQPADLVVGEIKAAIFGFVAGIVAVHRGLNPKGGPKGVGDSVNQSVVITFLLLFFINVAITTLYLQLIPPKGA